MSTQNNCSLMQVEIVDATNLRDSELLSTSDPYCEVRFESEEDAQPRKQRTSTIDNCLNPTWNERFHFLITDDVKYFDVKVKDKNMLRDASLGFCRVLRPSPEDRQKRSGGVFVLEKGKGGRLQVYCQEVPLRDIVPIMARQKNSLSLAARSYSDRFALLDLRIISAKDLRAADFNGKSDPYAVIKWESDADVFPKQLRTMTVKKSLNPTWDSVFHLLVNPSTATSFKVEVYDEDIGIDDNLGHVNVPLNEINLGAKEDYAIVSGKGSLHIAHCLLPIAGLFAS